MNQMSDEMLTVREVAEKLKLSSQCVYTLIESGRLVAHRFGVGRGTIRVSAPDLANFIADSRRETNTPQIKKQSNLRPRLKHIKLGPRVS